MKSVAEEDGLRKLLTSDEESEEEKNSSDESSKDEEKNKKEAKENTKDKKKSKSKKPKDGGGEKKESLSDLSSDSSDSEAESKKPRKINGNSASNSRSASPSLDVLAVGPSGVKRKLPSDLGAGGNSNGASENSNSPTVTPAKKTKYDTLSVPSSFSGTISSNKEYVSHSFYSQYSNFGANKIDIIAFHFCMATVIMASPKKLLDVT